jgi:hypothetical protein
MLIAPADASEVPVDAYAHSVILVDPATASIALVAIAKLAPASVYTEERKRHAQ